jgi:hypothetical protein
MASFALLMASPDGVTEWVYDGADLTSAELPAGTHMVTSGGAEDGKADRYLAGFASAGSVEEWRELVVGQQPQADPAALVVRHAAGTSVYATVFGQTIASRPGRLALAYSRLPWEGGTWQVVPQP